MNKSNDLVQPCNWIFKRYLLTLYRASEQYRVYMEMCGKAPIARADNGGDYCEEHMEQFKRWMAGDKDAIPPTEKVDLTYKMIRP